MFKRVSRASWFAMTCVWIGCGAGAAEPAVATSGAPTTTTTATSAHGATGLGAARALAMGESLELQVGCEGAVYLGPFAFASDGQGVTLTGTHAQDVQTCIGADFVDENDTWIATGGLGCSDGGQTNGAEASYEYAPGSGGNAASPVFVKVYVGDPRSEPCVPARVTVRRTR